MNKFLVFIMLCFALYFGAQVDARFHRNDPFNASHRSSLEENTSHQLALLTSDEHSTGFCTGTAIGPHAVLTAAHCLKDNEAAMRLDLGRHVYHIKETIKDDNEHAIALLDGPSFMSVQPYRARDRVIGEREYFYGFGGKDYPAHYSAGIVVNQHDPSEFDYYEGIGYYSGPSIAGDSGAAVYGSDGAILTLVSLHMTEEYWLTSKTLMVGYSLRFTPEQIKQAQNYEYKEDKPESDKKKTLGAKMRPSFRGVIVLVTPRKEN